MADVVLSYAREDVRRAQMLSQLLEDNGLTVWWDDRLVPGDEFRRVIEKEIEKAKSVIVLWSPNSVESNWVLGEAQTAYELNKLVPIKIGECKLPIEYRAIHTPDVYRSKAELDKLAQMLSEKCSTQLPRGATSEPSTAAKVKFSDKSSADFLSKLSEPFAFGDYAAVESKWSVLDFRLIKKDPLGAILFFASVGLIFWLVFKVMPLISRWDPITPWIKSWFK
jgi:TIR domain